LVPGLNTFSSTPCHNSYILSGCVITHARLRPFRVSIRYS